MRPIWPVSMDQTNLQLYKLNEDIQVTNKIYLPENCHLHLNQIGNLLKLDICAYLDITQI
jgi:predicted nucleotidyltransferase